MRRRNSIYQTLKEEEEKKDTMSMFVIDNKHCSLGYWS